MITVDNRMSEIQEAYREGSINGLIGAMAAASREIKERFPEEDFLPLRLGVVMNNSELIEEVSKRFEKYGYKLVKVEDE